MDEPLELFLDTSAGVRVITDGDIRATHVTSDRNIFLRSNEGDIHLRDLSTTDVAGTIQVRANGTDGFGNIIHSGIEGVINSANLSANWLIGLRANGNLTIDGNVTSDYIYSHATDELRFGESADVNGGYILRATTELGDIDVAGNLAATRFVRIRSNGNVNLEGSIRTEKNNVRLTAENQITQTADSNIEAGNNVNLETDSGDINLYGSIVAGQYDHLTTRGDINIDSGNLADITADLAALGEIDVRERGR